MRSSILRTRTCWPNTCWPPLLSYHSINKYSRGSVNLATNIAPMLADSQQLSCIDDTYYFSGAQNPAQQISLRHMSDNTFSIVLCSTAKCRKLDEVVGAGHASQKISDLRDQRDAENTLPRRDRRAAAIPLPNTK